MGSDGRKDSPTGTAAYGPSVREPCPLSRAGVTEQDSGSICTQEETLDKAPVTGGLPSTLTTTTTVSPECTAPRIHRHWPPRECGCEPVATALPMEDSGRATHSIF